MLEALIDAFITKVGRVGSDVSDIQDPGNYALSGLLSRLGAIGGLPLDHHSGIDSEAGEFRAKESVSRVILRQDGVTEEVVLNELPFNLGNRIIGVLGWGELLRRDSDRLSLTGRCKGLEGVKGLGSWRVVWVVEAAEGLVSAKS